MTSPQPNLPIAWKPHVLPHRPGGGFQLRALRCGASEALFGGAAGPGKTDVLIAGRVRTAQHPATRSLFLRTTYTDLKDVLDRMHALYPRLGARWHASDKRWLWPSGATTELGYGNNVAEISRYLGREFTDIAFDELGELAESEAWLRLKARVRSTDPSVPLRMRGSANPGGPGHGWLKARYVDPCGRQGERVITDPNDPSWTIAYVPGTALDNPSLPANYWDRLKDLPPALVKAWREGDWDAGLGLFYPEVATREMRERWWTKRPDIPAWWRMWGGYDWGFRHPGVYIPFVSDDARRVIVLDALYMHRRQDAEQAAEVQGLIRIGHSGKVETRIPSGCVSLVLAGGDAFNVRQAHASTPETVADVFNQYSVMMRRANLDRAAGSRSVRRLFGDDRIRFVRTPGTERLLEELGSLTPDPVRPETPLKRDADPDTGIGGDDGPDCLRYGLASMVWDTEPPKEAAPPWVPNVDGELDKRAAELRPGPAGMQEYRDAGVNGQFGDLSQW